MAQNEFDLPRFLNEHWPRYRTKILILGPLVILTIVALATCTYSVDADSKAVVKRFGKVERIAPPGLHFKLPFGIDRAYDIPTERVLKEEFGFRTVQPGVRTLYRKNEETSQESLMLTGDLNVIDVEWVVQYRIIDPDKYMHKVRDPNKTIRDVAEAVMRRIVGDRLGAEVLTVGRRSIETSAQTEMQRILSNQKPNPPPGNYDMGIEITSVKMQDVTPPDPVKPAFNDVNKARQERERLINQAEQYRNQVIPRAKGDAEQTIAQAHAYEAERVNAAKGESARFTAILKEYQKAPEITRRRMFLEMIDNVLPKIGRVYVMEPGQGTPLPLLNLSTPGVPAAPKGGK